MIMPIKIGGMIILNLYTTLPSQEISGKRLLWCVLSMYLPRSISRHGISVNTQIRL